MVISEIFQSDGHIPSLAIQLNNFYKYGRRGSDSSTKNDIEIPLISLITAFLEFLIAKSSL